MIAIATGTAEKAVAIREAINRYTWPIPIHAQVVPDLAQLIARFEGV